MSSGRRLQGKTVIITGGASGIGAEAARLFTEHGARVVIADVQDEIGQNVVVSIGEDKVSYYHCDVRDETEVENAVKFTVEKHGRIDVLFSNAGVLEKQQGSILDLDLHDLDRVMAVNLRGAATFIKHVARAMVESGTRGSIVCTTSVAAKIAGTTPHGYTASKHALLGLIKSAAGELGKHGIRVNGVAPFGIATPMVCDGFKMEPSKMEQFFSSQANMKGTVLKARHVAEAALFLASDDSAYVSGHNLAVDGGYTVVKP
uniref:Short-chain dehydrogenase reductase 3b n=1 Tax=Noccaea caerulescens TaxID=107243 RepID=A0A1J3ILX4_NOCCA